MEEKKKRGRKRIGSERVQVTCPPWLIEALDNEIRMGRASCRSDAARRILSEVLAAAVKREATP